MRHNGTQAERQICRDDSLLNKASGPVYSGNFGSGQLKAIKSFINLRVSSAAVPRQAI